MVHCIEKSKSDELILEIYSVNIFLALNCVITNEKNENLEQMLLRKMTNDLRMKSEPFYKASMLIALYSFDERDKAIEYLKEIQNIHGGDLHKVIGLLYNNADSNIFLLLLIDSIGINSNRILNNVFGYDYNSRLYCNDTKDIIKGYLKQCYKDENYDMVVLLIVRYEELIDFFRVIGEKPRDYVETLFNNGMRLKMYINKIISHEILKEAPVVLDTFYQYSNSKNRLENKIALIMGERLLNSEIIAIKEDVENIQIIIDKLRKSNLEPAQIKIQLIDNFINQTEDFNEEAYLQLLKYEKFNKYNLSRKGKKINKYYTRDGLDNLYIIGKTMKLVQSKLSIEKIIYIYLNTKLCEYCNLGKIIDSLNSFRAFAIDDIVLNLSKYILKGYVKKVDNGEILIRCANVDIERLVILDVDLNGFDLSSKNIYFSITKYEKRNFYAVFIRGSEDTSQVDSPSYGDLLSVE